MKAFKNLIMTYFFGFLAAISAGIGILYCWWYIVSIALENTKSEWGIAAITLWVFAIAFSWVFDRFEAKI